MSSFLTVSWLTNLFFASLPHVLTLWRCCQTRHLAFSIQYCCCQYIGTVEWEHAGWRHDPAKRPKDTGTTLVYGHASLQKLAANTDKNLRTRVHMSKMHMLDRIACREAHNQCSLSASLTSGGAWPARWPMHVSTSARACPWVCMCLLVWKSAVHPSEYCVFQFTSLAASPHNEAAARTRSYRKRWTVYFRYS